MTVAKKERFKGNATRVWKKHHGPIPRDEFGLSYDIHHIDGDRSNDSIDNLIALTVVEHYEVHYWQEDWSAVAVIMTRLQVSPEEKKAIWQRMGQANSGENHPLYDPTIYRFRNCFTGEIFDGTRYEFGAKVGASAIAQSKMIGADRKPYRGWEIDIGQPFVLRKPRTVPTDKFRFRHQVTGEIFEGTKIEFCSKTNAKLGSVHQFIRGDRQTWHDWEIDIGQPFVPKSPRPPAGSRYKFRHQLTGEVVEESVLSMASKTGLPRASFDSLIRGVCKSARGWTLIKE